MSQNFRLRFDQMRDGNPTAPESPASTNHARDANSAGHDAASENDLENDAPNSKGAVSAEFQQYGTPGHLRNVCFGWPEGKRLFLSYSYLVSGELASGEDGQTITLAFTSHIVVVQGYGLDEMYYALMEQSQRLILASESRYEDAVDTGDMPVVTKIGVEKNS